MSATLTTQTTLTNDKVSFFMRQKLLSIAELQTVVYDQGEKVALPQGQSDTVQFVRYERLGLPGTPLTEGTTPDGRALVVNKIQAVVDQWGDYVTLTDKAILTINHQPFQRAVERTGEQYARLADREAIRNLSANSGQTFCGAATSVATLSTADVLGTKDLQKVLAKLQTAGAPAKDNAGNYVLIVHPKVMQDLMTDNTVVLASAYSQVTNLMNGEIGRWMSYRLVRSNHLPSLSKYTSTNATSAAASASGDTALADATYFTYLVACDANGFEVGLYAESNAGSGRATSTQIVTFATPAFPSSSITSYNLYAGVTDGSCTLQARGLAASTTYRLSLDGTGTNGIAYSTTGIVQQAVPAASVTIYKSFVMGREWFACVELGGVETAITPPTASDSDPLMQRRKIGWKGFLKVQRLNDNYGEVLWSSSAY